ncbi:M28 family peptidase, partial [Candidatus Poribacteria bacterium]
CGMLVLSFILSRSSHSLERPTFDAIRAFKYLETQCEFGPRPPGSDAHKQTRDYLISELKKFAGEVAAQDFIHQSADGPLSLTNIIATFGSAEAGSKPVRTKKVLLAAHWDTRPFADRDPDPEKRHLPILGANDGASGVAVLLELARAFHSSPPDTQVIMVLFDGEDYGKTTDEMLLGSRYFARNMEEQWRPDYGILLDMVGDKDLDIYIESFSKRAAPDIVKKVWELARDLRLRSFYSQERPPILDDHVPLIEVGIKCIDIIDLNYPYWHSLEDTPDKCSPESLETVGKLLLELIYSQG